MKRHVMPDLHVVSLRYVLYTSKDVTYTNPPPVEFETGEARFPLAEEVPSQFFKLEGT
jgi:hypothetical protein